MEKKCSHSLSGDCFLNGAENHPLCKAMVDHDQQRVEARGGGKVSDKVTRDLLEGLEGMRFNWSEWWDNRVGVGFVLLASDITLDLLLHKLCKTRPSEFHSNELTSFKVTRVAGSLVVMAMGEDRAMEGVVWGNVDMALVSEDMVIVLPV